MSWIVFTLVAVGTRHWIGAVSAIWLLTLSAISGGRLLADSYLAWGLWLMASSLVGLDGPRAGTACGRLQQETAQR